MNLQLEVPDPNLCDSLRLMIKLMDEDRKVVEVRIYCICLSFASFDSIIKYLYSDDWYNR